MGNLNMRQLFILPLLLTIMLAASHSHAGWGISRDHIKQLHNNS